MASSSERTACLIFGAGWSCVAGRPLARELFDDVPDAASQSAARRYAEVASEWRRWRLNHGEGYAEQFIGAMQQGRLWDAVVEFVAARLAKPDLDRLEHELRYGERIDKPSPAPEHHEFVTRVLREHSVVGAVTTNYDLLVERSLRHRPMKRPARPGFHYVGISAGPLRGATVFSVRRGLVHVTGDVPLCKLHGSLNWVLIGGSLNAYADCRAAFRQHQRSFIVPPTPEKDAPLPLRVIWSEAETMLRRASVWIVVGYSAPVYDTAISTLLTRSTTHDLTIHVVDPNTAIADRFREITGRPVRWHGDLRSYVSAPHY